LFCLFVCFCLNNCVVLGGRGVGNKKNGAKGRIQDKNFGHATAMIYIVKNNCSGITKFSATWGRSNIYGDECTFLKLGGFAVVHFSWAESDPA
jgi:hypothetical protein